MNTTSQIDLLPDSAVFIQDRCIINDKKNYWLRIEFLFGMTGWACSLLAVYLVTVQPDIFIF